MIETAKTFIKKYKLTFIGLLAGAGAGYLYWMFIGCTTGSCSITSSPLYSSLWGSVLGGIILNTFEDGKKDKQEK